MFRHDMTKYANIISSCNVSLSAFCHRFNISSSMLFFKYWGLLSPCPILGNFAPTRALYSPSSFKAFKYTSRRSCFSACSFSAFSSYCSLLIFSSNFFVRKEAQFSFASNILLILQSFKNFARAYF